MTSELEKLLKDMPAKLRAHVAKGFLLLSKLNFIYDPPLKYSITPPPQGTIDRFLDDGKYGLRRKFELGENLQEFNGTKWAYRTNPGDHSKEYFTQHGDVLIHVTHSESPMDCKPHAFVYLTPKDSDEFNIFVNEDHAHWQYIIWDHRFTNSWLREFLPPVITALKTLPDEQPILKQLYNDYEKVMAGKWPTKKYS
jgi:hypothetical protein